MKPRKVFGIGYHKTGTMSLASAPRQLGYSVTGPDDVHNPEIAHIAHDLAFELAEKYDAFQDNPLPLFYRELNKEYPGSRFILTIRPTNRWIKSLVTYFGEKTTPMRQWIYDKKFGSTVGNEQIYIERYEQHNREVREYFKDQPDDLLTFRLKEGDGWKKLCTSLGEPVPSTPFPHKNRITGQEALSRSHDSFVKPLGRKLRGK